MPISSESSSEILNSDEVCRILKITRPTLYKLIEKKQIHAKKVGKDYRFNREDVLSYVGGTKKTTKPKTDQEGRQLSVVRGDEYQWELKDDFATVGIQKMAKRTFQEFSSNLEELIVNAYDEDATVVQVIVDKDKKTLAVIDDGNGMNRDDLTKYVIYGESNKDAKYHSPRFQRAPIGEYGMGGKLAISNLCRECIIITRKGGFEHQFKMGSALLESAKLISDIKRTVHTRPCPPELHSTSIFMSSLHYRNIDIDRLKDRLSSKMPKSQNFKIFLKVILNDTEGVVEIEEPIFEFEKEYKFEKELPLIGPVNLRVFYTKAPLPVSKQGIWTKVNGRIVNEKQEWFGLLGFTSGNRYKYRLYGIGNADGLKNYVTFSKNDFIDCPEYRQYYEFVNSSLREVQEDLLKADEDERRKRERETIKTVEELVNKVVAQFETADLIAKFASNLQKAFTENIEDAPNKPLPELTKVEDEVKEKIDGFLRRSKDKQERRHQSIKKSKDISYAGKGYHLEIVDMSENGGLVSFKEKESVIEINEKHALYGKASKDGYLTAFIRDIAFMEIARDFTEDNFIFFDDVFNQLAKIAIGMAL